MSAVRNIAKLRRILNTQNPFKHPLFNTSEEKTTLSKEGFGSGKGVSVASQRDERLQGRSKSPILQSRALTAPVNQQDGAWSTILRKTGKRKKTTQPVKPIPTSGESAKIRDKKKPKKSQPGPPKLPSPRIPAVLIKPQTEAADKGVTYAHVLRRAKESIDIVNIDLNDGLQIRRSATGARLRVT